MNKRIGVLGGSLMALALMAESFDQTFLLDDGKRTNLNPADIDITPKQTRPAAGCKEYWFNKNGGFADGVNSIMRKDESVFYCHAINDKSAIKKFNKWDEAKLSESLCGKGQNIAQYTTITETK